MSAVAAPWMLRSLKFLQCIKRRMRRFVKVSKAESGGVVIFGTNSVSSALHYFLRQDSDLSALAFTVDAGYLSSSSHDGLPVVAFDAIEKVYRPEDVQLMIPLGFSAINGLRRAKCEEARSKGYSLASYVSSRAIVWKDLQVRENCIVYDGAVINPFSVLGRNVMIRSNAVVSHHCVIGDDVFVATGAIIGGEATVGNQAFIGLGAIIRDGISVGERCFIGAGSVVISDTEPDSVYFGNPARRIKGSSINMTSRKLLPDQS